jgi:hypothetical protein
MSLDPLLITNYCIDVQIILFIYFYIKMDILGRKLVDNYELTTSPSQPRCRDDAWEFNNYWYGHPRPYWMNVPPVGGFVSSNKIYFVKGPRS